MTLPLRPEAALLDDTRSNTLALLLPVWGISLRGSGAQMTRARTTLRCCCTHTFGP